jgi:pimeloyl-ACP methyl ester carboxylesterase
VTEPVRDSLDGPDGQTALLRWPAAGQPRLVFAHANGFCASAYRQILSQLSGRFDIVAFDLRGHGRTTLPADPASHTSWDLYADDLAALYAALDRRPDILAGHSMGAASSLMAAARLEASPPLALIEPVVLPGLVYAAYRTPLSAIMNKRVGMGELARKRTNGWPDRNTVAMQYRKRAAFADWAPGAVEDYLNDGLRDTEAGVVLSCDPQWEAANFEAQRHDVLGPARKIADKARVLKAERGSTVWNAKGLKARGVQIDTLQGAGHLAPMSHPEAVADWILKTAEGFGL